MNTYYPFINAQIIHFSSGKDGKKGVQWTVDPSFRAKDVAKFYLEASESPKFDELYFSKDVGDTYIAEDDSNIQQSWVAPIVYRIKLQTADKVFYSPTLTYFSQTENWHQYAQAADIQRRELLRMRITGNEGWVLKRRTFSIYKSSNVDPLTGLPLSDDSLDAGTTAASGYYAPLKFMYSREGGSSATRTQAEGLGVTYQEVAKLRMIGCPLVTEKDVLVTRYGSRFIVNTVEAKQFMGTNIIILQNLDCTLLPPGDPMYNWAIE